MQRADDGVQQVLVDVIDATLELAVADALVVESLAYSLLLGSSTFRSWRRSTPRTARPAVPDPVTVARTGNRLEITLNDPRRHNAFSSAMRDALLEALDLVRVDDTIDWAELSGAGPSFCSGGDLDEFGTAEDMVAAHRIRVRHSVGLAVHELRDRVHPLLHGACIGAGIEIPAFADHLRARRDSWFALPELGFGLIPGAGGTVSIPRRIGRERFLELALTGRRIDAATALEWGLVDALV